MLLAREEKRAAFCFEKALAKEPQNWFWQWLAARIHYYYRQFARALKLAQQALNLDPSQVVVWLQLGLCQRALGLVGHAEGSFAQARELDPTCREAATALVELANAGLWSRLRGWWCQTFRT